MSREESIEIQRTIHLGNLLGEGGMGRVTEGFAPDLGQHLAVKQLRHEWMEDSEVRSRFEEEAAIMASIDHPGVLPVYGVGLDDQRRIFYVMKKVEGLTFTQLIGDLTEPVTSVPRRNRLLNILLDVCNTVASAHEKGIIHRDLKPDNILINRGQSVYVIDWGISKRTGATNNLERTLPGRVMGTPGYMAPEQAEGNSDRAGAEADVFALGVILYEILTGRRPFHAETDRAEVLGAIHHNPVAPRTANWLIPRDLNAICLKALHKNTAARYPNAGSLAEDLRAHLEGRPVSAVRPNPIEKIHYAARRHPMRAVIFASALTLITFTAIFIGIQRWADHRLAEKAMTQNEKISAEIDELEAENLAARKKLTLPNLPETDRTLIQRELEINNSRWLLAQFEAFRVLRSVTELRFIKTDTQIISAARHRLYKTIEACIERGNPALASALAATYLERAAEGLLIAPLSDTELTYLRTLLQKAETKHTEKDQP